MIMYALCMLLFLNTHCTDNHTLFIVCNHSLRCGPGDREAPQEPVARAAAGLHPGNYCGYWLYYVVVYTVLCCIQQCLNCRCCLQVNGFDSSHGFRIDMVGKEYTWVPRY